jgi:hypothetical protein
LPSQGNELPSFAAPFRRIMQRRHKLAFPRQPVALRRQCYAFIRASTPKPGETKANGCTKKAILYTNHGHRRFLTQKSRAPPYPSSDSGDQSHHNGHLIREFSVFLLFFPLMRRTHPDRASPPPPDSNGLRIRLSAGIRISRMRLNGIRSSTRRDLNKRDAALQDSDKRNAPVGIRTRQHDAIGFRSPDRPLKATDCRPPIVANRLFTVSPQPERRT